MQQSQRPVFLYVIWNYNPQIFLKCLIPASPLELGAPTNDSTAANCKPSFLHMDLSIIQHLLSAFCLQLDYPGKRSLRQDLCVANLLWDLSSGNSGTWDPLLQCCSACTWTNVFPSNKIQRNSKGLKITACTVGANSGQQDTKRPRSPAATSAELGAKQGTVHAPCTQHHQRGGQNT